MTVDPEQRVPLTISLRLFNAFQRVVAVVSLAAGLQYWAMLSGLYGGELWRFDLMPVHWQVAATALAVLWPVAAVGLWMPVSWGPVIWFIAAACEVVMHAGFPDLFGPNLTVVAVHAVVAVIYLVLRVLLHIEKRRSRQPVRVDSL